MFFTEFTSPYSPKLFLFFTAQPALPIGTLRQAEETLCSVCLHVSCKRERYNISIFIPYIKGVPGDRGGTVVKVLRYKSEGRWFDPSWCHWNFSLT